MWYTEQSFRASVFLLLPPAMLWKSSVCDGSIFAYYAWNSSVSSTVNSSAILQWWRQLNKNIRLQINLECLITLCFGRACFFIFFFIVFLFSLGLLNTLIGFYISEYNTVSSFATEVMAGYSSCTVLLYTFFFFEAPHIWGFFLFTIKGHRIFPQKLLWKLPLWLLLKHCSHLNQILHKKLSQWHGQTVLISCPH